MISRRSFLGACALASVAGAVQACSNKAGSAGARNDASGHLIVLGTGGTIACTNVDGALVPTVSGEELVAGVYDTFDKDKLSIDVRQVSQLDSSAMTLKDTDMIITEVLNAVKEDGVTGVIVTHGTDSMEESAIAVDTFLDSDVPVVFTGSMLPFDDPKTDGPANLLLAVRTATAPENRGKGVFIAFGEKTLRARGAYKSNANSVDGFDSNADNELTRPAALAYKPLEHQRVDIIAAYPGAPRALVDASLASGAKALVIEGMGAGNVGGDIALAISDALDKKIPVVMSTRVDAGRVEGTYGGAGGGATLAAKGVIGADILRAGQSRILLACALATKTDPAALF
ncbi:asparaginase [Corynebacterium diphtheriae]|nr:asparaginase [Corynebacterium diphtheriae]